MSRNLTTHLESLCGLGGHGMEWLRLGSREHGEVSVLADWQSATQQADSLRYEKWTATGKSSEPADRKVCVTREARCVGSFEHKLDKLFTMVLQMPPANAAE